ncbi:hypothetical protein OEA41_006278 [Lepraria neglecta]|uniref:Uncharacterized protein n=1 Tax=Lepraria neglecta TaxID=209136 RepID=A0AAD9ZA18_9LECA|nr:hypothetical protein OEA41_006278 [Lepraria neglecta]
MVELLLEYGADPNAKDDSGWTSLHHAAQGGHDRIVQLLLEYWADPNAKNNSGSTPLHIAAVGENILVVKLLCDSGADLEARDNIGSTPWLFPTQEDIARLLHHPEMAISQQAQDTPMFPITINGNILGQSPGPATELIKTKYVLVQSRAQLSPSDRRELDHAGVKHLNYVSKNTYLCQYQDGDLEKIGQLDLVVYINIYPKELKIAPSLKEAKEAEPDQKYEVDIIFHESVDPKSQDLQSDIIEKSHCGVGDFEFLPNKVRLPVLGLNLDSMASIDDVCHIKEVGEVVENNDIARRILQIDLQPPAGPI